jgi:RNA polymerase sigma-70 factor (ECF subfamily)
MHRTDHQLVQQIANRDQTAFAAFYDRHAARVLGLLIRLLGKQDAAEDVLQEAFWEIWTRAKQYNPARATPTVWLLWIARSRALDRLRRRAPETALSREHDPEIASDPAQDVERSELAQRMRAELKKLPDEQQSAVRLAFFDGLTHQQIAQVQQVPLGTAKTRIRLGMERLRDLLYSQRGLDL